MFHVPVVGGVGVGVGVGVRVEAGDTGSYGGASRTSTPEI